MDECLLRTKMVRNIHETAALRDTSNDRELHLSGDILITPPKRPKSRPELGPFSAPGLDPASGNERYVEIAARVDEKS
jgi:hypothetical protein